ncbi:MAG: hypothetical protein ACRDKW_05660, partial [Actinomycetota bacterium]
NRRRSAAISVMALTLLAGAVQFPVSSAGAAVPAGDADYSGYAASTPVHADAVETGDLRLLDVEEAFTGAAVASKGLSDIKNEVARFVTHAGSDKTAARGAALEVGLVQAPSADAQIILKGLAETSSPGGTGSASEEVGPIALNPIAYASLLKSTANTRWKEGSCILGDDLSRGYSYAADAQLLNLGAQNADQTFASPVVATDILDPQRNVTDSTSVTRLASANGGQSFGLVSEARQTIAPVTLLRGTPAEINVVLLGEWVLRAFASGEDGQSEVHYGPADASPDTPVVTITLGGTQVAQITAQQLLGTDGLHIPINLPGIADVEIAVGEPPRAIGGAYGSDPVVTATEASAAVDVVRVTATLLDTLKVEDVRVGHFETKAVVPAGGIDCNIPITKVSNGGANVNPGGTFDTVITIDNPFDCTLTNVAAADEITTEGTTVEVVSTDPTGTTTGTNVSWSDLPDIPPGGQVTLKVTQAAGTDAGTIIDTASVTADCGVGSVDGATTVEVALDGNANLNTTVGGAGTTVLGIQLPRTGGPTPLFIGAAVLALMGAAYAGFKGLRLVRQND